jgi:hypothetical protein
VGLLGLLPFFPHVILAILGFGFSISSFSTNLFLSILIFLVPILFRMTFGVLPFAALRARLDLGRPTLEQQALARAYLPWYPGEPPEGAVVAAYEVLKERTRERDAGNLQVRLLNEADLALKPISDPRELLFHFAEESSQLARRVYSRAGVYLMVGVLIAIGGLGFFYVRSINLPPEKDLIDRALSLLPGFGVLFFIEFVALFFLRQHRAAMDDFRYYDGVSRHREENLVILSMFAENKNVVPTADVIKAMNIYSGDAKLMHGETTEILEARRLQRDDIVIFEKLVEAFTAVKDAGGEKPKRRRLRKS